MSTHTHIGNPCRICGFPLTGKDAADFIEKQNTTPLINKTLDDDILIEQFRTFIRTNHLISKWENFLKNSK